MKPDEDRAFSVTSHDDDVIPQYKPQPLDGGYGWVIVCAACFNFVFVGGSFVCFPLIYYEIAEFFGVSLALAGSVQSAMQTSIFLPGQCSTQIVFTVQTVLGCVWNACRHRLQRAREHVRLASRDDGGSSARLSRILAQLARLQHLLDAPHLRPACR